jgi:hypothetical protein
MPKSQQSWVRSQHPDEAVLKNVHKKRRKKQKKSPSDEKRKKEREKNLH